jgi:hypothetical protein
VEKLNWFSVARKGPCHGEAEACLCAVRFDRAADVDCFSMEMEIVAWVSAQDGNCGICRMSALLQLQSASSKRTMSRVVIRLKTLAELAAANI